jgi:cell division septation protein DedD
VRDEEDDDEVRGGPGWFATLLGAALLLAAGFAVGVVVGAVREEPAMLLQYVTGKSQTLPAPAALPSLAAVTRPAAPAPPMPAPPAEAEAAALEPRSSAVAPSAPPPPARANQALIVPGSPSAQPAAAASAQPGRIRFAVQVGAFAQSSEAEKLEAQLKRKGLPAYIQPATGERDSRWRVRIGPLVSRDEADRVAAKLKTQDKLPVWVLEESS